MGVESMADPAGGSTQVSNLIIPVHRQRPRDSFRSRDLCLRRPARDASTSKMLSSTETKRQRRHKRSNLTRARPCEGKLQPVWRQQRTNSWHGSPDGQHPGYRHGRHRARRAGSRGRPFGESSPLRATFLMRLPPSPSPLSWLFRSHGTMRGRNCWRARGTMRGRDRQRVCGSRRPYALWRCDGLRFVLWPNHPWAYTEMVPASLRCDLTHMSHRPVTLRVLSSAQAVRGRGRKAA